jgi:acetyl esterase
VTRAPALAEAVRELLAWDAELGQSLAGLEIGEQRRLIGAALTDHARRHDVSAAAVGQVDEFSVPVEGAEIRLRLYTPTGHGPWPVFFHIHGGGFTLGSIDWIYNHAKCAHLCAAVGCAVTTVEYRLAPEWPFPTAPEDCFYALQWVVSNATRLGLDPARLAVGGESAGGNLAAVAALMSRDRGGPDLALQLLEVPVADMSEESSDRRSFSDFGEGFGLDGTGIQTFQDQYLPPRVDRRAAYVSPLLAGDLANLPRAHILTAEFDPLRDGGEEYARKLIAAGVPTTVHRHLGQTHGSAVLWSTWQPAASWMSEVVAALRVVFATPAASR